ncbi:asparaginyl-tRNA synthetase [Candidatus Magnetoovum chiemensis]|nr:asparaginyl-tRNA synthetase [Candidatus Magnetoovum chiemensis]
MIKKTKISELLKTNDTENIYTVKGWVRTKRESKNVVFIAINDGSTIKDLQIVAEPDINGLSKLNTGASVSIKGRLKQSSGTGQQVELYADEITVLGEADPSEYPLQPKKHSLEYLREIAHLRFRTKTFGAITRIRHAMAFAVHNFFNSRGFYSIHTPIITASDCEGAGELFSVTTLDLNNTPKSDDGNTDFSQDFFGKEAKLTVSGQLEAELAALALGEVYTFGPTFRAENSNTARHLAEFWMVEPEAAFYDLNDNINLACDFLKYLIQYALDNCLDDLLFLENRLIDEDKSKKEQDRSDMKLTDKLRFVLDSDFVRIPYTEAIDILRQSNPNKKRKFAYIIDKWGADLQSEHERYLVESHFSKKPVIVTDYPKEIKPFYMRLNDDNKTVRAMDILFPSIGEIIGGSQREERYDVLVGRVKQMNIALKDLWWYLETRKFGSVPHSGFGLGFERLLLFITGMKNIRDVIAFPRTPKTIEF